MCVNNIGYIYHILMRNKTSRKYIYIYFLHLGSEEILENPIKFITKHNPFFEWCYVDKLITSYFGYLPQNFIGRSIFDYHCIKDLTTIKDIHTNGKFSNFFLQNVV